jgi:hypothetical protein
MCDKGHEWQADVLKRSYGTGCPYCSGRKVTEEYNLSTTHPDVAGQWHPTRNGELTPDKAAPYSGKKVWWMCDKGHEWQAFIGNRSSGAGCPFCYGKKVTEKYNLSTIHPDVARQWHPRKNGKITPGMVTPYSQAKAWWKCNKGHEWQAIIANRSLGSDCPYCYSNKRYKNAKR